MKVKNGSVLLAISTTITMIEALPDLFTKFHQ